MNKLVGLNIFCLFALKYLDVSNNGIKETVENKPVFDPDFHTELIIKDESKDLDSGNEKSRTF